MAVWMLVLEMLRFLVNRPSANAAHRSILGAGIQAVGK